MSNNENNGHGNNGGHSNGHSNGNSNGSGNGHGNGNLNGDVPSLSSPARYKYLIVSEKILDIDYSDPQTLFVAAQDFIANKAGVDFRKMGNTKIINLCSNFDYLSKGYYVSLMAEARGIRCIPSVADMISLQWKRHYQTALPELNALVDKHFRAPDREPSSYKYNIYFGRVNEDSLEPVGRKLFDLFRFPMITVEIKQDSKGKWIVDSVEPLSIFDLPKEKHETFAGHLNKFTGSAWREKTEKRTKHWIGILYDQTEKNAPSDKIAIQKFLKAGKDLNVSIECITKNDYSSIMEYDALLLRETTAINHHTYRFAAKAESEGIPCIDDVQSIIRCCNKVFQYELLESKKIALPKTFIVDRKNEKSLSEEITYPAVIKIPDGSFSRGVMKVDDPSAFRAAALELLKKSDVILAQEFVQSDFDWRVGVLDDEVIFASKYFMAKDHWQVYNHSAKATTHRSGPHETVDPKTAPEEVLQTALKAAKLIGNGLYGVDLKICDDRIIVMEVNDNPNIDNNVEDMFAGDKLYQTVIASLVRRIESIGETPQQRSSDKTGDNPIPRPYPQRATGGRV